jgi:F0F1-type ATP synthase assembly protein I
MAPPQQPKPTGELVRSAGLLLAIPTLLIVSPMVGFFAGNWLDDRFRTGPWLGIAGLLLGFAAGARETARIYRRYVKDEEERRRR